MTKLNEYAMSQLNNVTRELFKLGYVIYEKYNILKTSPMGDVKSKYCHN
jgi:hypothetical protein